MAVSSVISESDLDAGAPKVSEGESCKPGPTDEADNDAEKCLDGEKRVKRKMALLFGYLGSNYRGLQINYQIEDSAAKKSVEAAIRDAMVRATMVMPCNANHLEQKVKWSRQSRTDAGVHAMRIVIAAKLLLREESIDQEGHCDTLVDELNQELPHDIRCFGAVKVPQSFDAKRACSWREYDYLLPTGLLRTDATTNLPAEALARQLEATMKSFEGCHSFHNFCRLKVADLAWKSDKQPGASSQDQTLHDRSQDKCAKGKGKSKGKGKGKDKRGRKRKASAMESEKPEACDGDIEEDPANAQRPASPDQRPCSAAELNLSEENEESLTRSLGGGVQNMEDPASADPTPVWVDICSKGTDGSFREKSDQVLKHTQSTMHMCAVDVVQGGELLRVRLRGQFFLYNQIRLMIGSAVAVVAGVISEELLRMALVLRIEFHMPLAPSLGLLLHTAGFSQMDARAGFMAMDRTQAERSMLPPDTIILLRERVVPAAEAFRDTVEKEVARQWAESGERESWLSKLKEINSPRGPLLEELRERHTEALREARQLKAQQADSDEPRREEALSRGVGSYTAVLPRHFAADVTVRCQLLPGKRVSNMLHALSQRLMQLHRDPASRPALFKHWPPSSGDLLQFVEEIGVDKLAEEGAD